MEGRAPARRRGAGCEAERRRAARRRGREAERGRRGQRSEGGEAERRRAAGRRGRMEGSKAKRRGWQAARRDGAWPVKLQRQSCSEVRANSDGCHKAVGGSGGRAAARSSGMQRWAVDACMKPTAVGGRACASGRGARARAGWRFNRWRYIRPA